MLSAPFVILSALALSLSLLTLSVLRVRAARGVQLFSLVLIGGSGGLLLSIPFAAPTAFAVIYFAAATYAACRTVAKFSPWPLRIFSALIGLGVIFAPFKTPIASEIQLVRDRAGFARLWAEASQSPLRAELAGYRLSLPWSPQIQIDPIYSGGHFKYAPPSDVFLDARHDLFHGGPPLGPPGEPIPLGMLRLIATNAAGRSEIYVSSPLEQGGPRERGPWCAANPAMQGSVWCQGRLSQDVTLRPLRPKAIDSLGSNYTTPTGLPPLPEDATGVAAQFRCAANRAQPWQKEPVCALRYQPLAGIEATIWFDKTPETKLHAAALQVMAELPPYLAAMGIQP